MSLSTIHSFSSRSFEFPALIPNPPICFDTIRIMLSFFSINGSPHGSVSSSLCIDFLIRALPSGVLENTI